MILQGTMQDGTVIPVQVDAQGRLVAEGLPGPAGPAGPAGGSFALPANPQEGSVLGWEGGQLVWRAGSLERIYRATVTANLYGGTHPDAVLNEDRADFAGIASLTYGDYFWNVILDPGLLLTGALTALVGAEYDRGFRIVLNNRVLTILTLDNVNASGVVVLNTGSETAITQLRFEAFEDSGAGANLFEFAMGGRQLLIDRLA